MNIVLRSGLLYQMSLASKYKTERVPGVTLQDSLVLPSGKWVPENWIGQSLSGVGFRRAPLWQLSQLASISPLKCNLAKLLVIKLIEIIFVRREREWWGRGQSRHTMSRMLPYSINSLPSNRKGTKIPQIIIAEQINYRLIQRRERSPSVDNSFQLTDGSVHKPRVFSKAIIYEIIGFKTDTTMTTFWGTLTKEREGKLNSISWDSNASGKKVYNPKLKQRIGAYSRIIWEINVVSIY